MTPALRRGVWAAALIVACLVRPARTAGEYPLTLVAEAKGKSAAADATATVTIHLDRLMEENRRTRVTDALKYGGYGNFLPALRTLPAIGTIALDTRVVEIRYAREEPDAQGHRLLLIADTPLFFFGSSTKARAGYELTLVDLRFDSQGHITGTMAGAARVKPRNGGVVLDNYAEALVQLTVHGGG